MFIFQICSFRVEDISCQFFDKVNSIPNCRAIGLGAKYLWTVLNDGEEVLHMVSCLMRKDSFALFNSQNVVKSSNSSSDIWAVALTDTRIVMFNKHLRKMPHAAFIMPLRSYFFM